MFKEALYAIDVKIDLLHRDLQEHRKTIFENVDIFYVNNAQYMIEYLESAIRELQKAKEVLNERS